MVRASLPLATLAGAFLTFVGAAARADVVTPDYIIPASSLPQAGGLMNTDYVIARRTIFNPSVAGGVPMGISPAELQTIYQMTPAGQGAIAIVDAYNYPTALKDFNAYAAAAGLPLETSTVRNANTNKVFQVVYGSGSKPANNASWNVEEALDIEIAHAMAPNAKIYLVEAASNSDTDLYAAVKKAAKLRGVEEVSMSWGGSEYSGETSTDSSIFPPSKVMYFASSGDGGAGAQYPAASRAVVGVGGTTLQFTNGVFTSETAWSGSGGGKSAYEVRPPYQSKVIKVVGAKRGIPDICADADPNSGVGIYVAGKWEQVGGTSLASPMCAAFANDANSGFASTAALHANIYANLLTKNFRDITTGSNGNPALVGYDLVTGVGSPIGPLGL